MEKQTDQFINDPTEQMMRYIGLYRGIQGHQNSCYLDSTIFGLFALSDVFDSMFLAADQSITTDQNRKRVANLLWKGIVNPLRKYPHFIVPYSGKFSRMQHFRYLASEPSAEIFVGSNVRVSMLGNHTHQ